MKLIAATAMLSAGAAVVALVLSAGIANAQTQHDRWTSEERDGRCFAKTLSTTDDGAYLSIQNYPGDGVRHSVAVVSGDEETGRGDVVLKVDGRSFEMLPFGDAAFSASGDPEAALIAAMRRGREMTVEWVPQEGASTRHTFSLIGFVAATRAIDRACG